MILIKCAYCELESASELWMTEYNLDKHILSSHPIKEYRDIKELLSSWKMIGLYSEKEIKD